MTDHRDYLDRCHSVAVFGGTFDPIHYGHLTVAEAVLAHFAPQRVLFMPCGQPPHKEGVNVTPAEHRYQMTLLATCDHPGFDVSRMELDRPGASFTIDTARQLLAVCPAEVKIYFIIGADSLEQLLTWKDAEALLTLCRFIAVPRPGFSSKQSKETVRKLNNKYKERIFLLDMEKTDISGTEIRRRITEGKSVRSFIPRVVEDYARAHHLYREPFSFDAVKKDLQKRLSPKRFVHTLGVIKEADALARHYGANVEKTRWAALLHDCAKEYSTDKKIALCKKWGIPLESANIAHIDLTHGPMGAESAKRDYYVNDPEILQAIRYHSTGHGAMTVLDKVIMLADFIEPYRDDYSPLTQMRKLAYTNMDKALRIGIKFTIKEEKQAKNPVHPISYEALKALK
ncbi:MAG: nicotinate-nucleotide adenylyltransferase [Defluviitaleaceae bacterium]|nr:nicotinate-nucleotide adenylyltransferase [Defluviitaleaceae bacterium]